MTSVGVISSAVARIKRLIQHKDYPATPPFEAHEVLERLEKIKELLVTVYNKRKEEGAEVEIKKAVQLSYDIVDVFVVESFKPTKAGTKKFKELVEKLTGVENELTEKIGAGKVPSETIQASSSPEGESSADSPSSKKATQPKGGFLAVQAGNARAKVEKLINFSTTKNKKSTTGSDSEPMVGSKTPALEPSTVKSESQVQNSEIAVGVESQVEKSEIRAEISAPSKIITASSSPEGESTADSPTSKKASQESKPKGGFLAVQAGNARAKVEKLINFSTTKNKKSTTGSDSEPMVGSKTPALEPSTIKSESQVEKTEKKSSSTVGSRTLTEDKATDLEQKPETSTTGFSEIQKEEEDRIRLMGRIKMNLTSQVPKDGPREVYIVGKSGMGKSTVARELFNDPDIRKKIEVSGWVTIGHNFQIKGVLQLLLQQLQGGQHEQQPDLREMNETELIAHIFSVVQNKSYLLVLEDVGSVKDWESICLALPLANSTRVIITTSSNEFSSCANSYELSGLTQSETLALLNERTIFRAEIGKAIFDITGGSPLYTRILGRSLESEANNPGHDLVAELASYKSEKGTPQVLDASYRRLAPELKPCFVYLGLFPPAQHIQVHKLYLLLSAENLISSPTDSSEISLPESFKKCMEELAGLELVRVEEDELETRNGLHNSCILHEQVQAFCKSKGLDEEFFEVTDFKSSKKVVGPETRRLAVYMRNYRGESSISFKSDASVKILSLLVFDAFESAPGKSGWPSEISDLAGFTHLRALNFDDVDFRVRKLPKGMEKLLLLRFLSFRGCFMEELPSYLSSLKHLETLDLLVRDDCCVVIPGNIFTTMTRMVHLFLPRLYQGNTKTKLRLLGLEMMETLLNFDTEVFDVEDLCQLTKLKILSTVSNGNHPGQVDAVIDLLNGRTNPVLQHSSMEIRNFDCYNKANISTLKKLLRCRFVDSVQIEGQIGELPEEEEGGGGSGRVTEMAFYGSELEDDPMGYFGRFQNLRSLVLADGAFTGTHMVISSSPLFPKLRRLKLRNLQYLETLTIEEGALRELTSLQIENCGDDVLDLTIPEKLYHRLKNSTRGDAYTVVPSPSKFKTTP